MTISFKRGIMFKLSVDAMATCSVEQVKMKINNCIANSMFLFFEIKTSTKGKRNFHISDVKLIWLIRKKDVKSDFKAL